MLRDAVESLLWPPMIKMLDPVDTAQDLNIFNIISKLMKFGTWRALLEVQDLQTMYFLSLSQEPRDWAVDASKHLGRMQPLLL